MEAGELVDHDQHIEGRAGELVDQGQSAASRSLQKIVGAIVGAASRAGREHLQGSSPPDSTERALIWFGTRADPRGRGPPCVMQANRTPVPMAVSSRPER